MDNVTHTLTGLILARTGLERWCPRSIWILPLAANTPDIDIISAFGGSLEYLSWHRHITHSLAALPVIALLPVAVVRLFGPIPWWRAWLVAGIGILSHLLLDLTNMYGVRLLLPFTAKWFRLDTTAVVDVWIWAALAFAIFWPALSGLVSSEIGAVKTRGRGLAIAAVLFLMAYNGGRYFLHQRAVAVMESRLYEGGPPRQVVALPSAFSPLRWVGIIDTDSSVAVRSVDLASAYDPAAGRNLYKPQDLPPIKAALGTPEVREFLRFSQLPYWRLTPAPDPEGGVRVEVMDLRFGTPPEERFVTTVLLDSELRPIESRFTFGPFRPGALR